MGDDLTEEDPRPIIEDPGWGDDFMTRELNPDQTGPKRSRSLGLRQRIVLVVVLMLGCDAIVIYLLLR